MEVHFPPELEGKLTRLAAEQSRNSESLIFEAVEQLVDYQEWFLRKVGEGLDASEQNQLLEDHQVRAMIDRRYPG